jgi:phosphoribosyl-dephospho-CoA transferase
VVARRASAAPGDLAVGVRGFTRSQRYAMTLSCRDIEQIVGPEDLAWLDIPVDRAVPAMSAMRMLQCHLSTTDLRWGPTGSVGFELASGVHAATQASDLDIIVRVEAMTKAVSQQLCSLESLLRLAPARVDCQVDTPLGAIAVAELTSGAPQLLIRHAAGPRLVDAADFAL